MQDKHVPSLGPRYWFVFAAVSVFGANASDLATAWLGAGHARGAPLLVVALVAAAILLAERYDRTINHVWYWLLIAIVPAASIHLADSVVADLGVGEIWVIVVSAVLLVAVFMIARSEDALLVSTMLKARTSRRARPTTDAGHWIAMVVASTLGTVLGDFSASRLGQMPAMLLMSGLAGSVLALHLLSAANRLVLYWLAVIGMRAAGGTLGDVLVHDLVLGLPLATALSGGLSLALLILWRERR